MTGFRIRNLPPITLSLLLACGAAWAADHVDGTATSLPKDGDINDVFAWTSTDTSKLNLVMTVSAGATSTTRFSDAVKYVFHTQSRSAFGAANPKAVDVICTFDIATTQNVSCWVKEGDTVVDYVSGNASATSGITSSSGKVKVFAGLRNDPFTFNLAGFKKTAKTVAGAAGMLTKDAAGCPALDTPTSTTLVTFLKKDCTGLANPFDFFDKPAIGTNTACPSENQNQATSGNVLALALQIDKTLLNKSGAIVSVWGATHQ